MDFFLELILEIILEGTIELSGSKRVPLLIRIALGTAIVLFFGILLYLLLGGIFSKNLSFFEKIVFFAIVLIILFFIYTIIKRVIDSLN